MSEPVVMVCMRLSDGPPMAAFTGFCMACKEVVALSAASKLHLDELLIKHGGPKHLICGQCYVGVLSAHGFVGQQFIPMTMAQLIEIAEQMQKEKREREERDGPA